MFAIKDAETGLYWWRKRSPWPQSAGEWVPTLDKCRVFLRRSDCTNEINWCKLIGVVVVPVHLTEAE